MLISNNLTSTIPHWMRNVIRLCALGLLPLGLVHCDSEVVAPELSPIYAQLMEEPSATILLMDPGAMETYVSAEIKSGSMTREEGDRLRQGISSAPRCRQSGTDHKGGSGDQASGNARTAIP